MMLLMQLRFALLARKFGGAFWVHLQIFGASVARGCCFVGRPSPLFLSLRSVQPASYVPEERN